MVDPVVDALRALVLLSSSLSELELGLNLFRNKADMATMGEDGEGEGCECGSPMLL